MTGAQPDGLLTEAIDCPLCNSPAFEVLRGSNYPRHAHDQDLLAMYRASSDQMLFDQVVRCRSCSLIYVNPRPRDELIVDSYAQAEDPRFFAQNGMRIRTFRRNLSRLLARFEIQPTPAYRVLDIGCAGGAFPKAATDLGLTVVGVEPCHWLARKGREAYGVDIREGTLLGLRLPPASFDMITLWDVLEHLTDPRGTLEEAARLVKPGGLLVVSYPDHASLVRRLMGWRWPFFLSVHLIYLTPQTATRLLSVAGFEVQEIRPLWQTLELGYVVERASAIFGAFRWLQTPVRVLGLGGLGFTYQLGQSLAVARRCA